MSLSQTSTAFLSSLRERTGSLALDRSLGIRLARIGGVAGFCATLLAYVQCASPHLVGSDGYYHIKMAALVLEHGLKVPFPWLPMTLLDDAGFTDHHMLLHAMQAPFVAMIPDLAIAAKIASVAIATLSFTVFYLVLSWHRVRFPFLWLVLLFGAANPFLYRMSMARGQSLSVALQLLAAHLILRRNAFALGILSAVFAWSYNGFPILFPLVLFGVIAHWIADRTLDVRLVVATAAGVLFALIVNPYFPQNVHFLWNHVVPKLLVTSYATSVGNEWQPYSSWAIVTLLPCAALAYLVALAVTNREEWRADAPTLFWLLAATMQLILLLKSRRFVEYFPPTAIMFLAFAARDRLAAWKIDSIRWTEARLAVVAGAAIALMGLVQITVSRARDEIRGEASTAVYAGGSRWLAAHTPQGARVFHTDWDDFPKLFFFNTHNTYLVGLDPDFMRLVHPGLYDRWVEITRGHEKSPENEIMDDFGARWVFTDRDHREFIAVADASPRMKRAYADRHAIVYRMVAAEDAPDGELPR